MSKDTTIITIFPGEHLLPGVGEVKYLYNSEIPHIDIYCDGSNVGMVRGENANDLFDQVKSYVKNLDRSMIEAEKRCRIAFNCGLKSITAKSRKREITEKRQIVMCWLKNNTKKSLREIGILMGNHDHATVLHAVKTYNDLYRTDVEFTKKADDFLNAV